jgi:hypothetical protein
VFKQSSVQLAELVARVGRERNACVHWGQYQPGNRVLTQLDNIKMDVCEIQYI